MDGQLTLTAEAVHQAVKRAWKETLPRASYGPTIEWASAGADSLDTLHLMLRLERYLDQKVSLDLVSPDMTPWSLASRLLEKPATLNDSERPPIFLIPGFFGDEPILADFRRSLSQHARLQTVELPDLGCPASLLSEMAATGRFVAREIVRRLPQGNILLAGYSFGGCVAFEAAVFLVAQGRQVVFLSLLDPVAPLWVDDSRVNEPKRQATNWQQCVVRWRLMFKKLLPDDDEDLFGYIDRLVLAVLVQLKAFDSGRRRILSARHRISPEGFERRRKHLLRRLRISALKRWRPHILDAKTLLVICEKSKISGSSHLWSRLCPNLNILRLPVQHSEIFEPQVLERLTPAFLEAIKTDWGSGGRADTRAER
jgi:thioesterase domain-containing protein